MPASTKYSKLDLNTLTRLRTLSRTSSPFAIASVFSTATYAGVFRRRHVYPMAGAQAYRGKVWHPSLYPCVRQGHLRRCVPLTYPIAGTQAHRGKVLHPSLYPSA
jgi:hypothetical protein